MLYPAQPASLPEEEVRRNDTKMVRVLIISHPGELDICNGLLLQL